MNDNDTRFLDDEDLRILMDNLEVTSKSTYDEVEIIKYSSDLTTDQLTHTIDRFVKRLDQGSGGVLRHNQLSLVVGVHDDHFIAINLTRDPKTKKVSYQYANSLNTQTYVEIDNEIRNLLQEKGVQELPFTSQEQGTSQYDINNCGIYAVLALQAMRKDKNSVSIEPDTVVGIRQSLNERNQRNNLNNMSKLPNSKLQKPILQNSTLGTKRAINAPQNLSDMLRKLDFERFNPMDNTNNINFNYLDVLDVMRGDNATSPSPSQIIDYSYNEDDSVQNNSVRNSVQNNSVRNLNEANRRNPIITHDVQQSGRGKGKEFFHFQAEVEHNKEAERLHKAIIAKQVNNPSHIPQKQPKLQQSHNAKPSRNRNHTARSIGKPKNQDKIREFVQKKQNSASFNHTLNGIDGVTITYLLNDIPNTLNDIPNTLTMFTKDKNTNNIYALNTVNYKLKEKEKIIKEIIEGKYQPNVPVEINGKKYEIPFEYYNHDVVDIAKYYKIPLIQQDEQGKAINDTNKTYSFYNANGQKQPYQKALMKNIPLCLINIDGHLSLCDFRKGKEPAILDAGFLFEKSANKKIDAERMQMQKNIHNLIGQKPMYIGIEVENENNTDIPKSQLLDKTNCVTGLIAILLDGYNPKEDINKHLCDIIDHIRSEYDGKSILNYQLLEKESIMSWYLDCHEKLKKDNEYTSLHELEYDEYLDRMIDSNNGERKAKLILIKESGLQLTGSALGLALQCGTADELKAKIDVIKKSGLKFTGSALGLALQCGTADELQAKIDVINKSGLEFTGYSLGLALQCGTAKELEAKIDVINKSDLQITGSALGMALQYGTTNELKAKINVIQKAKESGLQLTGSALGLALQCGTEDELKAKINVIQKAKESGLQLTDASLGLALRYGTAPELQAKIDVINKSDLQLTGSALGMALRSGTTKELEAKINVIQKAKESGLKFTGSALGLALQCGTEDDLQAKINVINKSGLKFTDSALGMALQYGTEDDLQAKINVIKEAKESGLKFTDSSLGMALQCGTTNELKAKINVIKESRLEFTGYSLGLALQHGTADELQAKIDVINKSGLEFTGYSLGLALQCGTADELQAKIDVIKEAKKSGLKFTGFALGLALQCGTAEELEAKIDVINKSDLQLTGSALGMALQYGTTKELEAKIDVINKSGLKFTDASLGMALQYGTADELKAKINAIKKKIGELPVSLEIIQKPLNQLEQYLSKLDIEKYKKTIELSNTRSEKKKARISNAYPSDIVVNAIQRLENLKETHGVDKWVKQDGFCQSVVTQMYADMKVMVQGNDNDNRPTFYKNHKTTIIRNLEKVSFKNNNTQKQVVKLIAFFKQLEDIENKNNRKQQDTNNTMVLLGKRTYIKSGDIDTKINDQGDTISKESTPQLNPKCLSELSTSNFKKDTKKRDIKEDNKNITKQKQLKSKERMEIGRV